jgi:hypothetical protein
VNDCRSPFTQILPLLREQPYLQSLGFNHCRTCSDVLLFNDPEFTQLFVGNVLLSPPPALKSLILNGCGLSLENRSFMTGFHKNTTIVELTSRDHDAATRLFIDPILRRNRYLGHVHGMLVAKTAATTTTLLPTSTLPAAVDEDIVAPTIPPACSLWPRVLAKVGQGPQGSSPVFMIFRDRLATWIPP